MSIFQQMSAIEFAGSLNLTIKKSGGQMVVSVILKNEAVGNKTGDHIPPLVLRGTPAELDAGFIAAIADPIREVNGLIVGVESFNKQKEVAAEEAAKTTGTKPAEKPAAKSRSKAKASLDPEKSDDLIDQPAPEVITPPASPIENSEVDPQTESFDVNSDDEELED